MRILSSLATGLSLLLLPAAAAAQNFPDHAIRLIFEVVRQTTGAGFGVLFT